MTSSLVGHRYSRGRLLYKHTLSPSMTRQERRYSNAGSSFALNRVTAAAGKRLVLTLLKQALSLAPAHVCTACTATLGLSMGRMKRFNVYAWLDKAFSCKLVR